jgi:peroxiredoxin
MPFTAIGETKFHEAFERLRSRSWGLARKDRLRQTDGFGGELMNFAGMTPHATPLSPGSHAPDFELRSTPDQTVSLDEFRGQPVILAFYPEDWSPVCSDQLALYQELLPEFQKFNAALVGISVDGIWCHLAFARDRNLHFPLLADFEPKGEVSRIYQVYRAKDGTSERALYVIDAKGIVRWSYVSPVGVNPGADGILRALESLEEDGDS